VGEGASGAGHAGRSITARARAELENRHLGALSPSRAAPRTLWDAFPSGAVPATAVSDGPAWLVPGFSKASPSATGAGLQVPEQQGPWHKMCSQMCLGSVLRALEATWGCLVAGLDAAAIQ